MAIKAVLYRLKTDGSQPYVTLDKYNLKFEWGIVEKNWVYLGIVQGDLADMQAYAQAEKEFDFKVITQKQAIDFYTANTTEPVPFVLPTKAQLIADFTSKI